MAEQGRGPFSRLMELIPPDTIETICNIDDCDSHSVAADALSRVLRRNPAFQVDIATIPLFFAFSSESAC